MEICTDRQRAERDTGMMGRPLGGAVMTGPLKLHVRAPTNAQSALGAAVIPMSTGHLAKSQSSFSALEIHVDLSLFLLVMGSRLGKAGMNLLSGGCDS